MLFIQIVKSGTHYALLPRVMTNTLKEKIRDLEKEAILNAFEECRWIQAQAARRLGITERMIGYRIKKYGIEIREVVKESNQ